MNLEDSTPEAGDGTPEPEKDLKRASPSSSRAQSSQRSTSRGRTGQGRRPASPPAQEKARERPTGPEDEPQPYQTFTVQFSLDEKNAVHHMEITHVNSGKVTSLTGYDREGLLAILDAYVRPAAERDRRETAVPTDAVDETPAPHTGEEGKVRAEALEAAMVTFHSPPSTLEVGEPATLCMTIDFGSAGAPDEGAPNYPYHALISAKPMHGGPRREIGTSSGTLTGSATTTIEVPVAPSTPEGVYQLEGVISLRDPVSGRPQRLLRVTATSLLQVNAAIIAART